jgi:hypothetical protein
VDAIEEAGKAVVDTGRQIGRVAVAVVPVPFGTGRVVIRCRWPHLDLLLSQRVVRDHYSMEQAAQILGKAPWTVREWCRQGRVHAEKRRSGRGRALDWATSHAELQRIEKEGLLPAAGKH